MSQGDPRRGARRQTRRRRGRSPGHFERLRVSRGCTTRGSAPDRTAASSAQAGEHHLGRRDRSSDALRASRTPPPRAMRSSASPLDRFPWRAQPDELVTLLESPRAQGTTQVPETEDGDSHGWRSRCVRAPVVPTSGAGQPRAYWVPRQPGLAPSYAAIVPAQFFSCGTQVVGLGGASPRRGASVTQFRTMSRRAALTNQLRTR